MPSRAGCSGQTALQLTASCTCYCLFAQRGWLGEWIQPKKKTLGAMDFGGASTQITFETRDTIEDPRNEVMLKLYGQPYKVYTHSFLCYGRDQVLKRLLSKLLQVLACAHPGMLAIITPAFIQGGRCCTPDPSKHCFGPVITSWVQLWGPGREGDDLQRTWGCWDSCFLCGLLPALLSRTALGAHIFQPTLGFCPLSLSHGPRASSHLLHKVLHSACAKCPKSSRDDGGNCCIL